jgi:5-formyltetrahydrofolate cyclo-ligase
VERQQQAAEQLARRVLALPQMRDASVVAAYRSLAGEPGTGPLIAALLDRGVTVLLPVLQPDRTLCWGRHEPGNEEASRLGILEPHSWQGGVRLLDTAAVVVCPGMAGDLSGHRLGRGGGSYDRALSAVSRTVLRCLLLYDEEVLDAVPIAAHDELVDVLVTPTRTLWTSAGRP